MKLDLKVEHSVDIKRKKPWPRIKWLGDKCEDVFVLDGQRASTLFLKNGETKKKIPKLQPQLESAITVTTSRNGAFLVGLQKKGNLFLWHKDTELLRHITGIPDVFSSTLVSTADKDGKGTIKPMLFISNDAYQILLVVGYSNLYLWEMKNKSSLFHSKDPNLQGKWSHISARETKLPLPTSKDAAVDTVFFNDLVLGKCCSCSFVFNSGSSIQISSVLLRWIDESCLLSASTPAYSAEWTSLNTPFSCLGSSCSAMLRRGAFVARHTNDGSTLAVAVNQSSPQNAKMLFISTITSTAIVSDLKGCGCKSKTPTMLARSYRVGSMEWTIDSLFLVCITLRGSLCIFSRLGDLLVLQAEGCSVELGPAYFLPFHPVVTLRTTNNGDADVNSDQSECDPMKQRFSVTTHPSKPMILCSDGYLVTVLSLPSDLTCETAIEQYLTEAHQTILKLNNHWKLGLTVNPLQLKKAEKTEMLISPNQNNSHPFLSLRRFGIHKTDTLNMTAEVLDSHEKSGFSASSDFSDYGKQFASVNEGKIMFGTMDSIDDKLETTTDFNELVVLVKKAHRAVLSAWGLGVSITKRWSVNLESLMQHTTQLIVLLAQVLMKCDGTLLVNDSTNVLKNDFSKFAKRYPRIFRVLLLFKCTMTLLHWDTLHKNLLPHILKIVHEFLQCLLASNSGKKKHVKAFACLYRLLYYSEMKLNSIYSYTRVVQPSFEFAHVERKFYESDQMESAVFQKFTKGQDVEKVVPVARLKAIATIQEILDQTTSLRGSLTRSMWHPGNKVACRHMPAKRLMMSWKLLHQKVASYYSELSSQVKQTPEGGKAQKQLQKLYVLLGFTQTCLAKLGCSIPLIYNKKRSEPRRKIFQKGCESLMFAKQSAAIDLWHTSYIRTQALTLPDRKPATNSLRHSIASDSLLAILYTHILNLDLVSAIEMVDSLVECYSLDEKSLEDNMPKLTRAHVSFLFALMGGKQDNEVKPPVLPCVIEPAAKVAVSTLARFLAMYFCNQTLFVYPPYNPQPLPILGSTGKNNDSRVVAVYHDQISSAIRTSDLSDILTVNLTLELLLVCGLHLEAIWFAKQLGDWKSSLVLAVTAKEHCDAFPIQSVKTLVLPPDLQPLSIVKENLLHIIQQSQYTAPQQQNASNNHKAQFKLSPMRLHTPVKKSLSIASLTEADKALHEQLSRSIKEILTAATVAKLDVTPWLLCQLMKKCLTMVAKFDRLVPDDFYLPAPPYFCPQPSLGIETSFSDEVQEEYDLRRETSDIIQLILLVLSASNCTMPCSRWYVEELMNAQEKLLDQDPNATYDFPAMLASYTACPVDLKALLSNADATRRSTKLLLQCFRDVCTIVWLLNIRDKLTMAVRNYQIIQDNVCSSLNSSMTIQKKSADSVIKDIIQWSKFLHSFSFFLNMEDEVQDILLTAVSNLPPSKNVAEILGEVFYSSKIALPAVEEKFQRVMSKLKKKKEKAEESKNRKNDSKTVTMEPLYVYYRKQCLKQKRLMISKTKILGSVEEQILGIYSSPFLRQSLNPSPVRGKPLETEETIEKHISKASAYKVGARSFETNKVFLDFLETFFLVAFGKFDETVTHGIRRTDSIPLLRSYADEIRQHELSTLAFGINKPQHCVELADAVLLRSQSFENMSKNFTLTRTETHETDGCLPSKVKGLFRSKRSYYFKKNVSPSIELLSIKYKTGDFEESEKEERPLSRLSQKLPSGQRINQSFDDIRALSRVSSHSSGRVSRSSFAKLRASKGSLMLVFDGSKPFADVNVVPGVAFNEIVKVQQWMTRWSNKRLPFDVHNSTDTTEGAIRVDLPQQLLVNCIWLIKNWYNVEKSSSDEIKVSIDGKEAVDVYQGKKNRKLGVAVRPNLNAENSTKDLDNSGKSKLKFKKKHSKISKSLDLKSSETEVKKSDGNGRQEPKSNGKKKKLKKMAKKKSSKSLDIHPVTSLDAAKLTEEEVELEKRLQQISSDSDDMKEDVKTSKLSHLKKQQKEELSGQTSLQVGDDKPISPTLESERHNILYRRSPVTGVVHTLTATHYYHSGEDSDSSFTSLEEKDVAKSLSEADLMQLDEFERKHSIPQSPLVSPCATMTRQHTDQQVMGFRKLVRTELKKLLEAQHKNTIAMLDTTDSFSGEQNPFIFAYNEPHQYNEMDDAKSSQRTKHHPSGRIYSTPGRSVKAVLSRRTTSPSIFQSSPETPPDGSKKQDLSPSKSTGSSKLFLTRSQSSEKNRNMSFSGLPSCNRNQNAVHSPEESDKPSPVEGGFSWIVNSDDDDRESTYQRDFLERPLPQSEEINPNSSQKGDEVFDQQNDVVEEFPLKVVDPIRDHEVNGLVEVSEQNPSVRHNEIQGWPLLSFDIPDSKGQKHFPNQGNRWDNTNQTTSKPFFLDRSLSDHLPPVDTKAAWPLRNIQDPDISNEFVAGFPLLKLNQEKNNPPFHHLPMQENLAFNFEPIENKEVYSSIWIPPLLHLERTPPYEQENAITNGIPYINQKERNRPADTDEYDSVWVPPLLHLDKASEDQQESSLSKHLRYFWAKEKNIRNLKLKLRGEQPLDDHHRHHNGKDMDHPDKVSMPLLKLPPMMSSDDSHSRRRRRRRHRDSSMDNQDVSSQPSSSSCGSEVINLADSESKSKSIKQKRRKLPKEPSKKSKGSEKKKKEKRKNGDVSPSIEEGEVTKSSGTIMSPSEGSELQADVIMKEVKPKRSIPKKGSYDHLLEGRQESYFPSSAEVHLKAVKGLQAEPVERVNAATMVKEMKNAGTSIDIDRVKLPEDDDNMVVLDQDGKAINDAIDAYTTAKTGLDNAGKILAPDIFFKLRFEGSSSNQSAAISPDSEVPPPGRNFISVVDLEGSRLLDDIPEAKPSMKPQSPEMLKPRSPGPSIASVHYNAMRNRELESDMASPREVIDEDKSAGPDPLTMELLAARKRIKKEQFSSIKAVSNEEREGYRKRMNMQLKEMDEQLKVIDEMSKQMEEDLQGTSRLMKNVDNITEFLAPNVKQTLKELHEPKEEMQQPQLRTLKAFDEKSDKNVDDVKKTPLLHVDNENDENTKENDENVIDVSDKEIEKTNDESSVADTTVTRAENTLGILGISGVSDIIAEVIADGDLNATELGISKGQQEAARQKVKRQQAKIDDEIEDLDFTSLNSKQIRELLKTPREEDDEKELWPSSVQPSKRTEQQKKELKEWTKKKREKAFDDYRSRICELRETEKTPFKTKDTTTLQELKKTEIERQTKRQNQKEEDYDERVKHAKNLMDQLFTEQTQLKEMTAKNSEHSLKKVPPKTHAKPVRGVSSSKLQSQTTKVNQILKSEMHEDDKRSSRIDPQHYMKLRESFERGVPLRNSSAADDTKRKPSLQRILERKLLNELGKVSDASSSSDDVDVGESNKENEQQAVVAPEMYKPKPFTTLVKVQRPSITRKGQDVPRTAKTYTEMLQDLKKDSAATNKNNGQSASLAKTQNLKSQQRLYGTKRLPGSNRLKERKSPRHPKPYTKRLQEARQMSDRPVGMRSRTPVKPYSGGLTTTMTIGETRKQQVERRGLKSEANPRVSTPYTERLSQLSVSGTFKPRESIVSPQPRLGLPYKPKENLGSTYVSRLKQASEAAPKSTYKPVYEPVPKSTYTAYKASPLRTPSPRHHPYKEPRIYEDQSVSEGSPWSLSDSIKRILDDDDSMAGISASGYPSDDDELGDLLDDQFSDYTTSVNIKELEEIASVNSGSFVSFEWADIDKIIADVK